MPQSFVRDAFLSWMGSFQDFQFTLDPSTRKLFRMLRTLFLRLILLLVPTVALTLASAGADTAREEIFHQGLSAYQNKEYAEAREHFQKILDLGKSDGSVSVAVLHNLALSAIQLDQKAYALALWRKALAIDPSFRPAAQGRDFIESKTQMRPLERDGLGLWLHRTMESTSIYQLLWLTALTLAFTGWLAVRYWGLRRHALDAELPLPPFPIVAIVLTFLLCVCVGLVGLKLRDSYRPRATVIANKAPVRALPTDDGVGLFDIQQGAEVLIRRQQDGWNQIQTGDGASGWVRDSEIFVTSAASR